MVDTLDLQKWLEKHSYINLIQYMVRHKSLAKDILKVYKDPFMVRYCHYGDLNRGKTIYHIFMGNHEKKAEENTQGFCSLLRQTLLLLYYADFMGFIPIVEWAKNLSYSEIMAVNDTQNSFEYFLNQTSEISLDDLNKSYLVVHGKIYDSWIVKSRNERILDFFDSKEIEILASMIKKYFHFNLYGLKEIVEPNERMKFRGKILGVHVRGTDFNENYSCHPIVVSHEEYLEKAKEVMQRGNYEFVFLATDEEIVINKFQSAFGNKLLFYECFRSENKQAIHYGRKNNRENHKYLLGLEIFRDVYALGCCNGLVAGRSNVAVMSLAFKKSFNAEYEDFELLDKGINRNLKVASRIIRKKL